MSFEEGFDAIAKVKASSEKLGEVISKVEELRNLLTDVHDAQENAGSTFEQANIAIAALTEKSAEIQKQQEEIENSLSRLPAIVDEVIEQRLSRIMEQMETRISERLRDELKETRTTLREAHESRAAQTESQMEKIKSDIIAEMPRGILGRRGA
ncbi:hypothetical protein [Cedecea sp. FDAARGOS_727]|uniref:hypothetical protein n=1 Tax=Cedecea sp. FDAARGOS_727 TaxID=2545798 RepID=UPI00143EDBF4|nr:hypothetical protein [Cedecea sp. FDAARGOS_727]QIX97761.1 coiled-coil domain-containing protein 22 [Cedecea sp. FDAARGOS_727]